MPWEDMRDSVGADKAAVRPGPRGARDDYRGNQDWREQGTGWEESQEGAAAWEARERVGARQGHCWAVSSIRTGK